MKKWQFGAYVKGLIGFVQGAAGMLQKRKTILSMAGGSHAELRERILWAEKDVVLSIMHRRQAQGKGNGLLKLYLKLLL